MTPYEFVGGGAGGSSSSSKKLVIMLEEDGRAKSGSFNRHKVSPLAIKVNNFLQWGAAGCVLPYLSVYFLRYTQADSGHVGLVMSIAAIVGTILNFVLGSLSDRYQAHREFYLISLILSYLSISIMFVPILKSTPAIGSQERLEQFQVIATPIIQETLATNETTLAPIQQQQQQPLLDVPTIDQRQPVWFYVIGACIAFGSLSITSNQIFSDSFSANMARECAGSFGSLRFYGGLGWCVSNFILATVNFYLNDVRSPNVPYLLPGWILFALLSGANILVIVCWHDRRPFDLSSSSQQVKSGEAKQVDKLAFVSLACVKPIVLVRAEMFTFDALEERVASEIAINGQNMRRCSIAPLGSSHVIQQFEVTPRRPTLNGVFKSPLAPPGEPHFKHITKVEPLEARGNQLEKQIKIFQKQQQQQQQQERECERAQATSGPAQTKSAMSLRVHMKIIELIARRNSNLARSMALYSVVGFVVSANWNFLFPYLELLDATKFLTISGYVMVSTYASETVFYYFSPYITSRVSAVNGLSVILIFLALRYSAYLAFSPSLAAWPLELMIVVEALQSVTMGWFDCIFSEQALKFALEAEACVPQLIELGLVDDTREAREQVTNGVKHSLMSLSSCFFDGIGVSIGSLVGGWLVGTFSFSTLWLVCVTIALSACAINVVAELIYSRNQISSNDEMDENKIKYQT